MICALAEGSAPMLQVWWALSRHNWRSHLKLKRDGYAPALCRGNEDIKFAKGEWGKEFSRTRHAGPRRSQSELWARSHFPETRIADGEVGVWERMEVDLVFSREASEENSTL